jgi:hypothetical protein
VADPWFGPVDCAEALSRLILNHAAALAPHPARMVVEIERPHAVSAFAIVPIDSDRTVLRDLLSTAAADPRFAEWRLHFHDETNVLARHFAMEVEGTDARCPAVVSAWRERADADIEVHTIRVEHQAGAHPSETIGAAQWSRLETAIRACGIDFDAAGRALVFERPAPRPEDTEHAHPSDLAIVVTLLIDAGHLHPAIAEDAAIAAGVLHEGTLVSAPISLAGIARWARRQGWRLHLCELTLEEQDTTGIHTWGYEHLGDLFDFWPPRRNPDRDNDLANNRSDDAAEAENSTED